MLQTPQLQRDSRKADSRQIVGVSAGRQIAPGANELGKISEWNVQKGRRAGEVENALLL
jgi:hypothetical protein